MPRPEGLRYARLTSQIPLSSGWPSWVRGAGSVRLGLPSLVRGGPGKGILSHWAWVGRASERKRRRLGIEMRFIWLSFGGQGLDRYIAIQLGVARSVHFAHATLANGREDFVRTESFAWLERHKPDS